MLNKKVLLGSLVAGAFLLPMTANAGIVNGQCYNCHTMHQTDGLGSGTDADGQDRTNVTSRLLFGDGCAGCHATGVGNDTDGKEIGGTIRAPQVDDADDPNLAGYFVNASGIEETQHNVNGSLTNMDATTYASAPGGSGAPNNTCEGCHGTAGHHGPNTDYRMLYPTGTITSADPNFGQTGTPTPTAANTTYDADLMNAKCANCHSTFHSTQGSVATGWIRHPTAISLLANDVNASYDYSVNYAADANTANILPLGTSGTTASDVIMCITCHFSHGGPNNDLLRWGNYGKSGTANVAGDDNLDFGCETCHTYTTAGQGGM